MEYTKPNPDKLRFKEKYNKLLYHDAFSKIFPVNFPDVYGKFKGVYGIKDGNDNYYYIGASIHVRRRIISHYNLLKKGYHDNKKILSAYKSDIPLFAIYLNESPFSEEYFNKKYIGERNSKEKFYHEQFNCN